MCIKLTLSLSHRSFTAQDITCSINIHYILNIKQNKIHLFLCESVLPKPNLKGAYNLLNALLNSLLR